MPVCVCVCVLSNNMHSVYTVCVAVSFAAHETNATHSLMVGIVGGEEVGVVTGGVEVVWAVEGVGGVPVGRGEGMEGVGLAPELLAA